MSIIKKAVLAGVTAAVFTATAGLTGAEAATACPRGWGSLAKASTDLSAATIHNVRAGRHACFDRLVIDARGKIAPRSYQVRYVAGVTNGESGLRGGAFLSLSVGAPAHDGDYKPTYRPANRRDIVNVTGFQTLRQVAYFGSYEGATDFTIGVRARLPYRVTVLDGPGTGSRLVLDVAHRW